VVPVAFFPEKLTVIVVATELGSVAATMIPQMSREYPIRNTDLVIGVSQSQGARIVKMRIRSGLGKTTRRFYPASTSHGKILGEKILRVSEEVRDIKDRGSAPLGMTIEPWS